MKKSFILLASLFVFLMSGCTTRMDRLISVPESETLPVPTPVAKTVPVTKTVYAPVVKTLPVMKTVYAPVVKTAPVPVYVQRRHYISYKEEKPVNKDSNEIRVVKYKDSCCAVCGFTVSERKLANYNKGVR